MTKAHWLLSYLPSYMHSYERFKKSLLKLIFFNSEKKIQGFLKLVQDEHILCEKQEEAFLGTINPILGSIGKSLKTSQAANIEASHAVRYILTGYNCLMCHRIFFFVHKLVSYD